MAFTVQDFNDLLELLAQHPEWRAELRRHVLTDELLELPALVRSLAESVTALTSRVDALAEAQTRTEERLARLESAIERLADSERRTGDRVGDMDGRLLELDFARKAPAYLGPIVRRLRVIEPVRLADLLDDAIDEGKLVFEDRASILHADVVMSGRRPDDGQDVYMVVEISSGVRTHDVERAVTRAQLLEKLGRPVLPIVAGRRIQPSAADLARSLGVSFVVMAEDTEPPDA
jgi:predicted RecB family endonuclease